MHRRFFPLTLQSGGQGVYVNRELITHLTGGLNATTIHVIGGAFVTVTQDIETVLQLLDAVEKPGTIAQAA